MVKEDSSKTVLLPRDPSEKGYYLYTYDIVTRNHLQRSKFQQLRYLNRRIRYQAERRRAPSWELCDSNCVRSIDAAKHHNDHSRAFKKFRYLFSPKFGKGYTQIHMDTVVEVYNCNNYSNRKWNRTTCCIVLYCVVCIKIQGKLLSITG